MILAVLLVLSFIVFYLPGVSPSVFGGDAGEVILSYYLGGIAHPPGYPLNTFLGFILTRLIPWSSFVFRADLVSTIYQAGSVALMFLLLRRLTNNVFVALTGASFLGVVPLFWLYAHVAEVFQLTSLLILICLLFLFEWLLEGNRRKIKFLYISVFFWGLSVFHHQIPLLLLPAFFYILWGKRKILAKGDRIFLKMLAVFLLGILPYIYTIWASLAKIPTNWGDASTFSGFWQLISRADYGTFAASSEFIGVSAKARINQVLWYLSTVRADFSLVGIILIILGLIFLFIKKRNWFWFFVLSTFFCGPFFAAYAAFPSVEAFLRGVGERFSLLSYLFLAVFAAFGMLMIYELVTRLFIRFIGRADLVKITIGFSFLLFPIVLAIINWPKTDLSDFRLGEALAIDILGAAQPPGIIFLQGDTATFSVQYSYYVDKVANNSEIIMSGRMRHASYRQKLKGEYPALFYPDGFTEDGISFEDAVVGFIEGNYPKSPLYSLEKLPLPDDYIWIQEGTLLRLYKKDDQPETKKVTENIELRMSRLAFEQELAKKNYLNFFEEHIRTIYSRFYTRNGFELLGRGQTSDSIFYFEKGHMIDTSNREALQGLGAAYLERKNCDLAKTAFFNLTQIDENYWQAWEGLGKVYQDCYNDEEKAGQYFQKSKEIHEKRFLEPIEKT